MRSHPRWLFRGTIAIALPLLAIWLWAGPWTPTAGYYWEVVVLTPPIVGLIGIVVGLAMYGAWTRYSPDPTMMWKPTMVGWGWRAGVAIAAGAVVLWLSACAMTPHAAYVTFRSSLGLLMAAFCAPGVVASLLVFGALVRDWQASAGGHEPRCAACGYNLTGNVSGVCPECGVPAGPAEPTR
jgi:hypothetical protein